MSFSMLCQECQAAWIWWLWPMSGMCWSHRFIPRMVQKCSVVLLSDGHWMPIYLRVSLQDYSRAYWRDELWIFNAGVENQIERQGEGGTCTPVSPAGTRIAAFFFPASLLIFFIKHQRSILRESKSIHGKQPTTTKQKAILQVDLNGREGILAEPVKPANEWLSLDLDSDFFFSCSINLQMALEIRKSRSFAWPGHPCHEPKIVVCSRETGPDPVMHSYWIFVLLPECPFLPLQALVPQGRTPGNLQVWRPPRPSICSPTSDPLSPRRCGSGLKFS